MDAERATMKDEAGAACLSFITCIVAAFNHSSFIVSCSSFHFAFVHLSSMKTG
jgi:hypothetical protein